ncbi:iqgap- protein, partial [Coemansia asiatica]
MNSRPRATTLSIDTASVHHGQSTTDGSFRRTRKVSGGKHVLEDMDDQSDYLATPPHSKAAALSAGDQQSSPGFAARARSRTVAEQPRPMSAMFRPGSTAYFDANSPITGRPLSALMLDPPDSPSVMGMKGRHRLQREASTQAYGTSLMRNGNWCDMERKNLAAYEYLCHVCEAKEWIEACIAEDLPP